MTYVVALHMPKGFRPMNPMDTARLSWGALVTILDTHDGSHSTGSVSSESTSHVIVKLRGGAEILIDRTTAQSADEQFVLLTQQLATDDEDANSALLVALRASNEIAKLKGRIRLQEEAIHRLANDLQGRPTQEQYKAIVADIHQLQQDYRILAMQRAS